MEENRLPSFTEILELKRQHPEVLKDRTHPQITLQSWIDNKNKAAKKLSKYKGKEKSSKLGNNNRK